MALLSTGVALAMSASAAFGQSPSAGRHFALCVGINQYALQGAPTLHGCVNDARDVADTLLNDSRWTSNNVYLATDWDATKAAIRGALYSLGSQAGPGDVVLYFQSSHGSQESGLDTSLVMNDAFYSDAELGADLAQAFNADTTVILIIDACHSGGLFRSTATREQRAATHAKFVQNVMAAMEITRATRGMRRDRSAGSNVAFITAADFDQFSQEQEMNGEVNGLFAASFVQAFSQQSTDVSGDGLLSFWELGSWAGEKAGQLNPEQTAQMFNESLLHATIASRIQVGPEQTDGGVAGTTDPSFDPALASSGVCGALGFNGPLMAGLSLVGAAFARSRGRNRRR